MLRVENLKIHFDDREAHQEVVKDITFSMEKGEILGLVGESGSGKSLTALTIAGVLKANARLDSGAVYFRYNDEVKRKNISGQKDMDETIADKNESHEECGEKNVDLLQLSAEEMRKLQGSEISMIFQEPMTALNPTMRIGRQIEEALRLHTGMSKEERHQRVLKALEDVELDNPEELVKKFPHELSGGMRQRVMIASAIVCRPQLLIADEPTTALDVDTQKDILQLLKKLNQKYEMSILFISHNLRVVSELCQRVLVMKDGEVVEEGSTEEIFANPGHEYTKTLIAAIPGRISGADKFGNDAISDGSRSDKPGMEGKKTTGMLQENEAEEGKQPNQVLTLRHVNAFYKEGKIRRQILKDVSFTLYEGEIAGLVGESGSGKSTLCKSILGLLKEYDGDVIHYTEHPQMVFQDPYASLNPKRKIGKILEEPLRIRKEGTKESRRKQAEDMLERVHLPREVYDRYPRELSGGQRQRVSIALALMTGCKFILADEALSALDVTVQAQMIALLRELQEQERICYLFVSHDLDVVNMICDRVFVLENGEVREKKNGKK